MDSSKAQIICSVITGIITLITAIIGAKIWKSNREVEKRAERRKKESILSLEMMSATLQLSIVTANALTGGHNNGNVEKAKEEAMKAQKAYVDFERSILAEEIK